MTISPTTIFPINTFQINTDVELEKTFLSEEEEIYKENILDHYKNPRNKKIMADCTFSHRELNPLCGDEITIYVKTDGVHLHRISFVGRGCAISQAAASLLTEELQGKRLQDISRFTPQEMLSLLGIPISHTRQKCALLAFITINGGLSAWR